MQIGASFERVADFLAEEEVDDDISSLKRGDVEQTTESNLLGLEHAFFRWNSSDGQTGTDGSTPNADSGSIPLGQVHFELHDINIIFPSGRLSIVTGATASGKTALLMALLGEMTVTADSTITHLPKDGMRVDVWGLRNAVSFAARSP